MGKSVLATAISEIGTKESPANSNNVKYNTWYYGKTVSGKDYPWCAVFMAWCFEQAKLSANIKGVKNKAYCPSWVEWAKAQGRWDKKASKGAIAIFDWDKNGVGDHIGIVESIKDKNTIVTIEGNTAVGNDSNGGEVMRRTRKISDVLGFIHVTIYPPTPSPTVYSTGTVKCYGTHGRGDKLQWYIDPARKVKVYAKYITNKKDK